MNRLDLIRRIQLALLGRQLIDVGVQKARAIRAGDTRQAANLNAQAQELKLARGRLVGIGGAL